MPQELTVDSERKECAGETDEQPERQVQPGAIVDEWQIIGVGRACRLRDVRLPLKEARECSHHAVRELSSDEKKGERAKGIRERKYLARIWAPALGLIWAPVEGRREKRKGREDRFKDAASLATEGDGCERE